MLNALIVRYGRIQLVVELTAGCGPMCAMPVSNARWGMYVVPPDK